MLTNSNQPNCNDLYNVSIELLKIITFLIIQSLKRRLYYRLFKLQNVAIKCRHISLFNKYLTIINISLRLVLILYFL